MKNPKLIDEAWIDAIMQEYIKINTDTLTEAFNKIKSALPTPTKTNVEKIRAGEMAIENDSRRDLKKCCECLFNNWNSISGMYKYYWVSGLTKSGYGCSDTTTLPTIKASELIKEIEGVAECKKFCGMNYCDENGCTNRKRVLVEPTEPTEWQPKFGDKITVDDCGIIKEGIFVSRINGIVYWLTENEFNSTWFGKKSIEYVKPFIQTLTRAEAEAKLNVKIVD